MIKYRHRNVPKYEIPATFAYELPPAWAFQDMILNAHEHISFNFGMTLVHPKDQYVKAIGREYAARDLNSRDVTSFHLVRIEIYEGRVHFCLSTDQTKLPLWMEISVDFATDTVRLEFIQFQ